MNRLMFLIIGASLLLTACSDGSAPEHSADHAKVEQTDPAQKTVENTVQPLQSGAFVPPSIDDIPEGKFGEMVRKGQDI